MTAVNTGDIRLWVEANSAGNWLHASVRAQVLALCGALDEDDERIEQQGSLILWQRKALERKQEQVRVLTEALWAVEWEQNGDGSPWRDPPRWFYCPSCGNVKNTREEVGIHAPDCALAAALATAGEKGVSV